LGLSRHTSPKNPARSGIPARVFGRDALPTPGSSCARRGVRPSGVLGRAVECSTAHARACDLRLRRGAR
jgi:hypothetical protein